MLMECLLPYILVLPCRVPSLCTSEMVTLRPWTLASESGHDALVAGLRGQEHNPGQGRFGKNGGLLISCMLVPQLAVHSAEEQDYCCPLYLSPCATLSHMAYISTGHYPQGTSPSCPHLGDTIYALEPDLNDEGKSPKAGQH